MHETPAGAYGRSRSTDSDRPARIIGGLLLAGLVGTLATLAQAQPAPVPTGADEHRDPLTSALAPTPGGLGPEAVARRAVRTSHSLGSKQAELRAAAAEVDQALVGFFPIVSTSFSYSRLSPVENQLDLGISIPGMDMSSFSFPVINDSYSWDTQVVVPFSDYLLRLTHAYVAAEQGAESKRLAAQAEALRVAADAKVAFFNWLRAKANRAVAALSVEQIREHIKDANATLAVGLLSRADLLRLESQLAQAEQLATSLGRFEAVAEKQLRLSIHIEPSEAMTVGIDVLATPRPTLLEAKSEPELEQLALEQRAELRALDAGKRALEQVDWLAFAGYFPRVDGFLTLSYANPNQRYFPQDAVWNSTWVLGVKASWTVNDTFRAIGANKESSSNVAALEEQRLGLEDGIAISVAAAYAEAENARSSIRAAERAEVAAEEGLGVRRNLFRAGKATSTDMVDAESELTRARLQRVNAHVDLLVAQAKLAYAVGVDALPQQLTEQ